MMTMKQILAQCGKVLETGKRRMLSYLENCPISHRRFIWIHSKTRAYFPNCKKFTKAACIVFGSRSSSPSFLYEQNLVASVLITYLHHPNSYPPAATLALMGPASQRSPYPLKLINDIVITQDLSRTNLPQESLVETNYSHKSLLPTLRRRQNLNKNSQ